jgi:regulator of sigma E protease
MLGGVTVNIILGFTIYMMIMFIWGKTVLPSESLPMGLNPSPIAQELGFEKGDKILYVDGKKLDNVLDINNHMFLRDIKTVTIKNKNGITKNIFVPEGIGKCLSLDKCRHFLLIYQL